MHRKFALTFSLLFAISTVTTLAIAALSGTQTTALAQTGQGAGSLVVMDPSGKPKAVCPLKHTDVKAEISGFLSRVNVTQEFENPFKEKIEAVYTFPLPQNAAVDDMTMTVGERTIKGKILRREEARAIYDAAKAGGQVASLLDQERPNIFTQSVANILPGAQIKITISYVETLKYESGVYEFMFPMVVGPRYVPGNATSAKGDGFSPDTDKVPDGSRITPQPVPAGMRVGHDISLDINIDAGVPIESISSKTHQFDIEQSDLHYAHVRLKNGAVIPNKDFVLRYAVAGKNIQDGILTHRDERSGYFTLILQPPDRVTSEDVTPKELVFVLDTSGSMSGFPIEKAKETMKLALDSLYPADTFNLITFAGDTRILFPEPVPATKENLRKAQQFLSDTSGAGGTEMMKAIKAALDPSDSQKHVRIVCFMTDGYVGNDMEIIGEVQKHPNARVFSFGIGSSVNRFLLDKMAEEGRGEVEYVALNDDGSAAARRFHERVRNPLLTDISIDWSGLPVTDVYPARIPDLFGAKPVMVSGRYTGPAHGTIKLKGNMAGKEFVREIGVDLPDTQAQNDVLASLWARNKIDNLMSQDFEGAQQGAMKPELQETITNLGIDYRLLTQFTSFVAVEEMVVTDGGQPRRIDVPVEVPEGVNREAIFDERKDVQQNFAVANAPMAATVVSRSGLNSVSSPKAERTKKAKATGGGGAGGGGIGRGIAADSLEAEASIAKLSPEQEKHQQLLKKFDTRIVSVIERLKQKGSQPSADEIKFVRDGKAELQIWLNEKTPTVIASLKQLGFEIVLDPKSSNLVIGRLSIDKLESLSSLKVVRYVSPQLMQR